MKISAVQRRFIESILPWVERHARFRFRWMPCRQTRDDAVAECIGLAWKRYLDLARCGVNPDKFGRALAKQTVSHVMRGRRWWNPRGPPRC